MNFKDFFEGKKIVVVRIGLLGRGVGDAAWLAEQGAEVLVVDDAPQEVMQPSVDTLSDFDNVKFKFGEYDFSDFKDADFVLVGAGTPVDLPVLGVCREADIPLKQSAAWFAELSKIPVVGVTGTRGKSTVTHMIHHVITELTGESVLLGGNIRGVSNLQLLNEVKEDSIVVMELDSWQLQGWGWSEVSPQISVFTNFMPDHMDYYKNDMDAYFSDKANIFRYQEESGVLVTTPEVFERAKKTSRVTLGQEVVLVDDSALPEDVLLSMPGEHNRLNAAIAYEALKAVGLSDDEIFSGLASFPGVPGRLEYLGEISGIKIYNDNNATTPEATVKGLQAVGNSNDKNVILVAGGAYKGINPQSMIDTIPDYCKKVFLLPGTGTDLIKDKIDNEVFLGLESAVKAGVKIGESGDVLLFSPGFASFGLFKNEYERNDSFVQCIQDLEED